MIRGALLAASLLGLAAFGCQSALDAPAAPAALDEAFFRCQVQPVLTKSCAAFACHGDARRYFHLFARNRLRAAGAEKDRNAQLSSEERAANLESTRALVDPNDPDASLLLLKPLESSQGGYFHRGATLYAAGNVFATKDDPDLKILSAWAHGAQKEATCVEPGSNQ